MIQLNTNPISEGNKFLSLPLAPISNTGFIANPHTHRYFNNATLPCSSSILSDKFIQKIQT